MTKPFEELAYSKTPLGELTLRRRRLPTDEQDVYEIKLGDQFLMSSKFTTSEIALAELALKETPGNARDVLVAGLGLGYTACAVLGAEGIRSLVVVERFQEVIDWHLAEIVPAGRILASDARCRFKHADFFELVGVPSRDNGGDWNCSKFHAVLVDIDHSTSDLLSDTHASFYTETGLRAVATYLHPGGVFALWSNDAPDDGFLARLQLVFDDCDAKIVAFDNLARDAKSFNTVYIAHAR